MNAEVNLESPRSKKNAMLGFFFTPITFAVLSAVFGFVAYAIPESTYEYYLNETKYVNGDVLLYVTLCVFGYVLGYRLLPSKMTLGIHVGNIQNWVLRDSLKKIIILLLILIIAANIYSILYFFSRINFFDFLQLYSQGRFVSGGIYRIYSESVAGFSWLVVAAPPVLAVSYWINWRHGERIIPLLILNSALILSLIRPLLRGDRGVLIGLAISLVLLRLYYLYKNNKLTPKGMILSCIALLIGGLFLFVVVQISRTGEQENYIDYTLFQLMGYYVASFNRLGFEMIHGGPIPPSNGFYAFGAVADFPIINKLLPLSQWLESLTGYNFAEVTERTFEMWLPTGLNPNFNVITAFGYIYLDFGWFGILYFLFYGWFTKLVINSLRKETLFGVAMYGPVIWGVMEWRGKLEFVYYNFTSMMVITFLLVAVMDFVYHRKNVAYLPYLQKSTQ